MHISLISTGNDQKMDSISTGVNPKTWLESSRILFRVCGWHSKPPRLLIPKLKGRIQIYLHGILDQFRSSSVMIYAVVSLSIPLTNCCKVEYFGIGSLPITT